MRMRKKIVTGILAAVLSLSVTPVLSYAMFSDVPENEWYAPYVYNAQLYGVMEGMGNDRFEPYGQLSLAQAITLAARTHMWSKNIEITEMTITGSEWYEPYITYASLNDICKEGEFGTNYNQPCSRLTMAVLFERVYPRRTQEKLNSVSSLPDIQRSGYGESVYYLYEQGVLTGSDSFGTFNPYSNITRAETATILSRVLYPPHRKAFTLETRHASSPASTPKPETSLNQVNTERPFRTVFEDEWEKWYIYLQFFSDGSLYGFLTADTLWDSTSVFKGTWSQSNDQISIKTNDPSGEYPKSGSYKISGVSSTGFTLKQTSVDGGFAYAPKGTTYNFKTYSGDYSTKDSFRGYVEKHWNDPFHNF